MPITKYIVNIVNAEGERTEVASKSKKATAVDLARQTRKEQTVSVEVVTNTGKTVFEMPAPKKIRMSPRFTRVVELPEGVSIPDGKRVAYFRPRRNGAILHDPSAEKGEQYSIIDVTTGRELKDRFPTTRAAGARLNHGVGKGTVKAKESANA